MFEVVFANGVSAAAAYGIALPSRRFRSLAKAEAYARRKLAALEREGGRGLASAMVYEGRRLLVAIPS